jgi:hypothetical protein
VSTVHAIVNASRAVPTPDVIGQIVMTTMPTLAGDGAPSCFTQRVDSRAYKIVQSVEHVYISASQRLIRVPFRQVTIAVIAMMGGNGRDNIVQAREAEPCACASRKSFLSLWSYFRFKSLSATTPLCRGRTSSVVR